MLARGTELLVEREMITEQKEHLLRKHHALTRASIELDAERSARDAIYKQLQQYRLVHHHMPFD